MTTSSFTDTAKQCAASASRKIILIDGRKLTSLMFEHNVGVQVDQTFELKEIDESFFQD